MDCHKPGLQFENVKKKKKAHKQTKQINNNQSKKSAETKVSTGEAEVGGSRI